MTRKGAMIVLDDIKVKIDIPKAAVTQLNRNAALDMAISDMKHVEELEAENAKLKNCIDEIRDYLEGEMQGTNIDIIADIMADNGLLGEVGDNE